MPCRTLSLFALLVGLSAAFAQPSGTRLRGESESGRTRKRLTEAQQKLIAGQPVADELQDILDQSGDDLVLVRDNQYQPARRLVQQYLATLPDKQLETFRDRIEEPAKKLLEQGKKRRDMKPLRELVERYFVSRPAEEGLLLLGELSMERGDFTAAGRYWRMLLPDTGDGATVYPKPKTDPAGVKAKLVLLKVVSGDKTGATTDLEQFKKDHPKASGVLGGTNGVYADTLAKLIAVPPAVAPTSAGWTSFAGGPARDGRPNTPLPRYLAGQRPVRVAIPREPKDKDRLPAASVPSVKSLAFHPIILNGSAYIADAGRVIQFEFATGTARVVYHAVNLDLDFDAADFALPCQQEADFTLTAADGKLFARFGKSALPTGNDTTKPRSVIACLEPKPDAAKLPFAEYPLTAKWSAAPPVPKDVFAAWEGAPLVADGRVYAAFVRVDNNRLIYAVACYAVAGGPPVWVADVFDTDPAASARHRHELLTLAGGNVVYCSHDGVTVAVSAATGKPAWAYRNPPADRPPVVPFRDLCPAVYHDGRVFIAPADGDAVYALDADTGRKVWSTTNPIYPEQLLGVSDGKLVVTTHVTRTGPQVAQSGGVRGYDVASGFDKAPVGWQNHEDGSLNGLGRGVVADNLIFWPTAAGTKILDPATGRLARPTNTPLPGNVAVADGYIVVATATEVWWYQFDGDAMVPLPRPGYPLVGAKDLPAFDPKAKVTASEAEFGLPAVAEERKAVMLPPFARPLVPLLPAKDAPLVLCDGRTLFAHDTDGGKELWRIKLGTPAVLKQVAFTSEMVLAVGNFAVIAADGKSGKIAWEFHVPVADPTPPLSAFMFAGNRLVARLGDNSLIALDLGSGKVAWAKSAANDTSAEAYSTPTAPKFGPHLGAVNGRVYAQRGDECWQLDAATGERLDVTATCVQEWTSPPVVSGGRAVLPNNRGELVSVSGEQTGRFFTPNGGEAGRSGSPPAARAFGQSVFVVVSKNVGDEVYHMTADRRPTPRLLPGGVDLSNADADAERLYLLGGGKVFALSRETMKESWRTTLPELPDGTRWTVRAGRTTLVVCPTEAVRVEPWDTLEGVRSAAYHPTPLRLLGTTLNALAAATRFTLPVLILDPATGKVKQRIDVSVDGPAVAVTPRSDSLLVAGVGRAIWLGKK